MFVWVNMILGYYVNEFYSFKYEVFKVVKIENRFFDRDRYKEFFIIFVDLRFFIYERNINY